MSETFADFDVGSWHGLLAPKGTPQPIVDKLAAEVKEIFSSESVKKKLFDIGAVARPMSPTDFAGFIQAEQDKYQKLVKDIGLDPM